MNGHRFNEVMVSGGTVFIPKGARNLTSDMFMGCDFSDFEVDPENPDYLSTGGFLLSKDGKRLIVCPPGRKGEVRIPDGVAEICDNAFRKCVRLTGSLSIPSTVKTIWHNAFRGCMGLDSVIFGSGMERIGDMAFGKCTGLSGTLELPDSIVEIGTGAFLGCSRLTGLKLPSSLKGIRAMTFADCRRIEGHLELPGSVGSIGHGAFMRCRNLSGTLVLPGELRMLGAQAFDGCRGFSGTVAIPPALLSVGMSAFRDCGHTSFSVDAGNKNFASRGGTLLSGDMRTVIAPSNAEGIVPAVADSVEDLGGSVDGALLDDGTMEISPNIVSFGYAHGLPYSCRRFHVREGNVRYGSDDGLLLTADGRTLLRCPPGMGGKVIVPDGVGTIGSSAFENCAGVGEIVIPDSVTEIADGAFWRSGITEMRVRSGNASFVFDKGVLKNVDGETLALFVGDDGWVRLPEGDTHWGSALLVSPKSHVRGLRIPSSTDILGPAEGGSYENI